MRATVCKGSGNSGMFLVFSSRQILISNCAIESFKHDPCTHLESVMSEYRSKLVAHLSRTIANIHVCLSAKSFIILEVGLLENLYVTFIDLQGGAKPD